MNVEQQTDGPMCVALYLISYYSLSRYFYKCLELRNLNLRCLETYWGEFVCKYSTCTPLCFTQIKTTETEYIAMVSKSNPAFKKTHLIYRPTCSIHLQNIKNITLLGHDIIICIIHWFIWTLQNEVSVYIYIPTSQEFSKYSEWLGRVGISSLILDIVIKMLKAKKTEK